MDKVKAFLTRKVNAPVWALIVGALVVMMAAPGGSGGDLTAALAERDEAQAALEQASGELETAAKRLADAEAEAAELAAAPQANEDVQVDVPDGVPDGVQAAVVEKIVDGDTIWVRVDSLGGPLEADATHKVRLLEYDSPESTNTTECYGPEASERLAMLIPVGATVFLLPDKEDTDRYGRFLRYVWTEDGTFVNLTMVQEGFGEAALYMPNDLYIAEIRAAEADAKAAGAGMWTACQASEPEPEPAQQQEEPAQEEAYYANCTEAREAGAAPLYRGDPGYRPAMDRDNDGVACE